MRHWVILELVKFPGCFPTSLLTAVTAVVILVYTNATSKAKQPNGLFAMSKKNLKESNMQWVRRKLRPHKSCSKVNEFEEEVDTSVTVDTGTPDPNSNEGATQNSNRSARAEKYKRGANNRTSSRSFMGRFKECFGFRDTPLEETSFSTDAIHDESVTCVSTRSTVIEETCVGECEHQLTERDARALLGRSPCSSPLISRRASVGSHRSMGAGPGSVAMPSLHDIPPPPIREMSGEESDVADAAVVGIELRPSAYRVYSHVHYLGGDSEAWWYDGGGVNRPCSVASESDAATAAAIGGVPRPIHTQVDYVHHLVPRLADVAALPCYWGVMDRYAAESRLAGRPDGAFLLRDSAQPDYLYSVSFRRYDRSLHARIEQWQHRFSFDSHDRGVYSATSVNALLDHYKDPGCCLFFEPMLTAPLARTFAFSLQHLCRAVICDRTSYDGVDRLPLPPALCAYLKYYHYKQMVRVRHLNNATQLAA